MQIGNLFGRHKMPLWKAQNATGKHEIHNNTDVKVKQFSMHK